MSTRATIRFNDHNDEYYVYRGHDGFPSNVLVDIKEVLTKIKGRWSEPELGLLVTSFLGMLFDEKKRLPNYEITSSFHGDESYRYFVTWDEVKNEWDVNVGNN